MSSIDDKDPLERENATLRAQLAEAQEYYRALEVELITLRAQLAEAQHALMMLQGAEAALECDGAKTVGALHDRLILDRLVPMRADNDYLRTQLTTIEQIAQGLAEAVKTLHAMWGQSDTGLAALAAFDAYQQQKGEMG
jgi:chromosome segregation ATPase